MVFNLLTKQFYQLFVDFEGLQYLSCAELEKQNNTEGLNYKTFYGRHLLFIVTSYQEVLSVSP
jgi:hypothetical protein